MGLHLYAAPGSDRTLLGAAVRAEEALGSRSVQTLRVEAEAGHSPTPPPVLGHRAYDGNALASPFFEGSQLVGHSYVRFVPVL
jgi:hypothetical protein